MAPRKQSFSWLIRCRARRVMALSALIVAAGLAIGIEAGAHQGAHGVIMERMTLMKDFGASMKAISAVFKNGTPYDPELVASQSATLSTLSKKIPGLFRSKNTQKPSEAKVSIWEDWQEFERLTRDLDDQSSSLAEQAKTLSARDARGRFARIAKTCTACHAKFRLEPKNGHHR